jgi:hypothetical protein
VTQVGDGTVGSAARRVQARRALLYLFTDVGGVEARRVEAVLGRLDLRVQRLLSTSHRVDLAGQVVDATAVVGDVALYLILLASISPL